MEFAGMQLGSGSSPLQRFPRDARSVTALGIARSSCELSSVYALISSSVLPGSWQWQVANMPAVSVLASAYFET